MLDLKALFDANDGREIWGVIRDRQHLDTAEAREDLKQFLLLRDHHTYDKHLWPVLATRALLTHGPVGVRVIESAVLESERPSLAEYALDALWVASEGDPPLPTLAREGVELNPCELNPETVAEAKAAIVRIVDQSRVSEEVFDRLITFISHGQLRELSKGRIVGFRERVWALMSSASIRLSQSLIDEFRQLIDQQLPEETYQRFLTDHPVFLDPLAKRVIPKQRLGIEHVTDFVVQRADEEYLVVEIEKPQDLILTRGGDFTAQFTHAYGQVLQFQDWIEANIAYAQRHMPTIASPAGILVIGRRADLRDPGNGKLNRLRINTPRVRFYTFDDLIEKAELLLTNLHRGA